MINNFDDLKNFNPNWIEKPVSKLIKCSTMKSYVPLDAVVSKHINRAISDINPCMLHEAINYVCDEYLLGTDTLENKSQLALISTYPILVKAFSQFKDLKSHLDFITFDYVGQKNFMIMEDNGTFLPSSIIYFRTVAALYSEVTKDTQKNILYEAFIQGLCEYSVNLTLNNSYDISSTNLKFLLPKNYLQSKRDRLHQEFNSQDNKSILDKIENNEKDFKNTQILRGVNPVFIDSYLDSVQDRFEKIFKSSFNKSLILANESYEIFFKRYPDPRELIDILLEPNTQ